MIFPRVDYAQKSSALHGDGYPVRDERRAATTLALALLRELGHGRSGSKPPAAELRRLMAKKACWRE